MAVVTRRVKGTRPSKTREGEVLHRGCCCFRRPFMGWDHAPFRFFLGGLGSALKARSQAAVHAKVHLLRFAVWTQTVEERIEEYSLRPVSPATGANTARTLRNKNIIKKRRYGALRLSACWTEWGIVVNVCTTCA